MKRYRRWETCRRKLAAACAAYLAGVWLTGVFCAPAAWVLALCALFSFFAAGLATGLAAALAGALFTAARFFAPSVSSFAVAVAALPIIWQYLFTDTQRNRFLSLYLEEYADPLGIGLQQRYSDISIGLGQLLGKGLFKEDYWYVPNMHNDFVFAFIGINSV